MPDSFRTNASFVNVSIALWEPNEEIRKIIVATMRESNFLGLSVCHSLVELSDTLAEGTLDVIILAVDKELEHICRIVRAIRGNEIGNNPFLILMALVTAPDPALIRKVLGSGFDDVLVKPLSANTLIERMTRFATARKPFVITSDYIGPDRRDTPRRDGNQPVTFNAPNPIRIRIEGGSASAIFQSTLDHGAAMLNTHKMERNGEAMLALSQSIFTLLSDESDIPALAKARLELEKLIHVAEDVQRRTRHGSHAHLSKLGDALHNLATTLRAAFNASPSEIKLNFEDVRLLPQIAAGVAKAIRLGNKKS